MENEKNLDEQLQENAPAEPVPEEETVPAEAAAEEVPAEETPVEETPAEETAAEEVPAGKKATPGKIAIMVTAIVLVVAVIVGLLMTGSSIPPAAETAPATVETEPPATVPADGNPDDETCKGTYTVTDEAVIGNADTVVATIGEHTLTNSQLQAFYWAQVQSFLSSEYGNYMMYYGVLDYTRPLDTQVSPMMENGGTWQQFFLKEALSFWRSYCALADKGTETGLVLTEEDQAVLDGIEENLQKNAEYYGLASVAELLKHNIGAGADLEDYKFFQEMLLRGNKYYESEYAKLTATAEELETFYAEHEEEFASSGITREGKYVDVRHILFVPEGGTTDETTGETTYSEEEWEACRVEAQDILDMWLNGARTEESFGALATSMTDDPGSMETGGLYEQVTQGQMVAEFDAWCFDEARVTGDYGLVKTTYGYHVMYFVSGTPIWEYYAKQDLLSEKTMTMMEELTAQYPIEVDYSAIMLGNVELG